MPYFQRKPIEELVDAVRSIVPIPGLPSRGRAPATRELQAPAWSAPSAAITGIVEQAAAVLASERPSGSPALLPGRVRAPSRRRRAPRSVNSRRSSTYWSSSSLRSLAGRPVSRPQRHRRRPFPGRRRLPTPQTWSSSPRQCSRRRGRLRREARRRSKHLTGKRRRAARPDRVLQHRTDRRGRGSISLPRWISFQPRELMLSPGKTGEVTVRVVVPAQTRCGVYSGLVRASKLDYLHAVLVVQVEAP